MIKWQKKRDIETLKEEPYSFWNQELISGKEGRPQGGPEVLSPAP